MIITYDIYTQTLMNARAVALQRAKAEGWVATTILSVNKVYDDMYQVTLSVYK